MNFNFKTREDYIAYRTEWKKRYFDTIKEIRKTALAKRDSMRSFSKVSPFDYSWKIGDPRRTAYSNASNAMIKMISQHQNLKKLAYDLLNERMQSKIEAGLQRARRLNLT